MKRDAAKAVASFGARFQTRSARYAVRPVWTPLDDVGPGLSEISKKNCVEPRDVPLTFAGVERDSGKDCTPLFCAEASRGVQWLQGMKADRACSPTAWGAIRDRARWSGSGNDRSRAKCSEGVFEISG